MKNAMINVAALLSGLAIGYVLVKGVLGIGALLAALVYLIGWAVLIFCAVSVILLPFTVLYWCVRSLIRGPRE